MAAGSGEPSTPEQRSTMLRRGIGLGLAGAWVVWVWAVDLNDLSAVGERMLAIFGVAVVLWVSEAIPLFATAAVIILAEILVLSDEAVLALPSGYEAPAFSSFYAALANPVLMLFLGGFFLADASAKYGLDRNLAGVLLRPFSRSPAALLGGLMLITALLSMFMSNTATTAAMVAVVLPVALAMPDGSRLGRSLVLAIPVAANIGGMGTPVGSPPNAIALGVLADDGVRIDFLRWMALMLPIVVVVLALAWAVLRRGLERGVGPVDVSVGGAFDRTRPALILYATFGATILAWLTEPIHGVPATIVGFVPVVVLLSTGVIGVAEMKALNWHVLWLVGGGIALGVGVSASGLDEWMVGLVEWSALSATTLVVVLVAFALAMSTFISNSATANLLVPIAVTLAGSGAVAVSPALAAVVIAGGCSLAMALPVSTPPNAVAYATGVVSARDLLAIGAVVGLVGGALVAGLAPPVWEALGLLP